MKYKSIENLMLFAIEIQNLKVILLLKYKKIKFRGHFVFEYKHIKQKT